MIKWEFRMEFKKVSSNFHSKGVQDHLVLQSNRKLNARWSNLLKMELVKVMSEENLHLLPQKNNYKMPRVKVKYNQ